MGDDDAIDIVLGQQHIDALAQGKPVFVAHVLAGDLKNLLAGDIGDPGQLRDGLDQRLHTDGGSGVADRGGAGAAGAGDGAAGGQDGDVRELGRLRLRGQGEQQDAGEQQVDAA